MALVASIFPQWTLLAVVVHILFMGNFIYVFDKPYFCAYNCCTNYFFSIMLGTVFLFHFIATNDGPQKFKISFFYIVCGLENVACSIVFYLWVDKATNRYWQLYLVVIWICFVCGLVFKVVYYRWFHPNITAREKVASSPVKKKEKEGRGNEVAENIVKEKKKVPLGNGEVIQGGLEVGLGKTEAGIVERAVKEMMVGVNGTENDIVDKKEEVVVQNGDQKR